MKYRWEIITFLCFTLILVFIYIQHRNYLIHLSYRKQKGEHELSTLTNEKEKIANALLEIQRHDFIKKRAQKELGMRSTDVKQMSSLLKDSLNNGNEA